MAGVTGPGAEPLPQAMRTSDFDYDLPPDLIAQRPIEPRDHARLLVVRRADGSLAHRRFLELPDLLEAGDLLIVNDSRVIPARLHARKSTGGAVELLLLRRAESGWWLALARPSRRLRPGTVLSIQGGGRSYEIELGMRRDDGLFEVRLEDEALIAACGEAPLPPYIHERLADPERYQTVYAREEGSAAAPTAGLHFTPGLMERLAARGVELAYVTLHVGLDTFRPVEADDPREHHIHTEYAVLPPETAQAIARARERGSRVVAVGTTSVRTLESAARGDRKVEAYRGDTGLMILPGHEFRAVDAMVTNFHLPRSTLLMLVSAFAGKDVIDAAYAEAVRERYRFYSFGDAMLLL